jgi:hypothetical protein
MSRSLVHRVQRSKLTVVLFVAFLLLGGVIVTRRSAAAHNDFQDTDNKAFVIQMTNGRAACRAATAGEARATLPSRNNRGVPVAQIMGEQRALAPGDSAPNALTIQLNALSQLQTDSNRNTVIAAFQRAAATWSARIKTPITITINIDYGFNMPDGSPFDDGVVGSTGSGAVSVDYTSARANLIATACESGRVVDLQLSACIFSARKRRGLDRPWKCRDRLARHLDSCPSIRIRR